MQKRIDFISFEEFKELYGSEKNLKRKLCILLGFGSGLRISEIIGLKKEISICCNANVKIELRQIDNKKHKVNLCEKCNRILAKSEIKRDAKEWKIPPLTKDKIDLKKHQLRIDLAKGGKWRITVIPPLLKESHLNLLPLNLPRRTLQDAITRLSKRVLGKAIHFHTLRHGFGNYQANVLRIPLPIVQQMMGHSRLDSTGIYTKANPEFAIKESWKAMTGEE